MKIVLQPHLKIRLKQRFIPQRYPSKILHQPDQAYFDTQTKHLIAVKKLKYSQKIKPMVVAYDIIGENLQVITIYPTSHKDITSKVKNQRWLTLPSEGGKSEKT